MRPIKIIAFTIVAILVVIVAWAGVHLVFGALAGLVIHALGVDLDDGVIRYLLIGLFLGAMFLMPRDWLSWNRRYECHGTEVIDAPIEHVWDKLQLRHRDDYFSPTLKKVRPVPGTEDEFHLLVELTETEEDAPPGLRMPSYVHLRLVDEVPNEYLAYYTVNAEDLPLFGKDHLMTEVLLCQTEDGVKVTYIETMKRVTLWSFLAFLFLNPARDGLVNLKAQIEGGPNASVMQQMAENSAPDGTATGDFRRALNLGAVTAVLFTTGLAFAVFYAVLAMSK